MEYKSLNASWVQFATLCLKEKKNESALTSSQQQVCGAAKETNWRCKDIFRLVELKVLHGSHFNIFVDVFINFKTVDSFC